MPSTWARRPIAWTPARGCCRRWAARGCTACHSPARNPAVGEPRWPIALAGGIEPVGPDADQLGLAPLGNRLPAQLAGHHHGDRQRQRPTTTTGPPIPGNLPTMDSGTSDGSTDQELARLANFMTGGNENPTSTQPAATPRSVQAAIPLLPTGSPAATAISNPEGRDTIGDVMNDQGPGTWTPYGNPLYQPPGELEQPRR